MTESRMPYMELVKYWRACVADTTLKLGRFRRDELPPKGTNLLELSADELVKGRLDGSKIKTLFEKTDPADGKGLNQDPEVCFWPVWRSGRSLMVSGAEIRSRSACCRLFRSAV